MLQHVKTTSSPIKDAAAVQPMNAMDRSMLCLDRAIRGMGYSGFETQALVWLDERADGDRLRTALDRLVRLYPIVAARLDETRRRGGPRWRLGSTSRCRLGEADLPSDDPQAVLDHAAGLLSTPNDLAQSDPIRFHLLHRPDGRDVFLMQYNHSLIDNTAALPVLQEIDRLASPGVDLDNGAAPEHRDLIAEHLGRFPLRRRLRAAARVLDFRFRCLRGGRAVLGNIDERRGDPGPYRIVTRSLDAEQARDLELRVRNLGGFPSLSMALLASAFRAVGHLAERNPEPKPAGRPRRDRGDCNFIADLGLDTGLRRTGPPLFQNLASIVPVRVRRKELNDRDELTRTLSTQLRERLEREIDLGVLQLASMLGGFPRLAGRLIRRVVEHGLSLWYAYFGSVDPLGDEFCGTGIESAHYTTCAPVGLTLVANQHRGRLLFQVTYVPRLVADPAAREFLDFVVGDLTGDR